MDQPSMTEFALLAAPPLNMLYLPVAMYNADLISNGSNMQALIGNITTAGTTYEVDFSTSGFTPEMPGTHLHFFTDLVSPEQAGSPGSGPWKVYAGPSPYTGYSFSDIPNGVTQLCVLVANSDHTVQPNSGNCYTLPPQ